MGDNTDPTAETNHTYNKQLVNKSDIVAEGNKLLTANYICSAGWLAGLDWEGKEIDRATTVHNQPKK